MLVRADPLKPRLYIYTQNWVLKPLVQTELSTVILPCCIICCSMLLNFFPSGVKMYLLLSCMVRDKDSNAENGKMPA